MENLNENEIVLLGLNNADVNTDEDVIIVEDTEVEEAVINGVKRKIVRKPKDNKVKIEMGANNKRTQVLERIGQLSKEKQNGLIKGQFQISDKVLYSLMTLSEMKDGALIKTDGGTSKGVRNISNGKYSHDFLLQAIQLVYDETDANGTFDADLPPEILNGEIAILSNGKTLIEDLPVISFASVNGYPIDKKFNEYRLDNPKWFKADTDIKANLSLSAALTDGHVKILLIGSEIRPL
ncbi:MAG: hypothetical protein JXR68_12740 [Bacteroidales bacterium]|nr:hypothetical protein [Bacteroidales bacterium]